MYLIFFFDYRTGIQRQQYQTYVSVLKSDRQWAAGRQCIGGAQGTGFQMSYLMVINAQISRVSETRNIYVSRGPT